MKKLLFVVVLLSTLISCSDNKNQDLVQKRQLPRSGDGSTITINPPVDYDDSYLMSESDVIDIANEHMGDIANGIPTVTWITSEEFIPVFKYDFYNTATTADIEAFETKNYIPSTYALAVVNYGENGGYAIVIPDYRANKPFVCGRENRHFPHQMLNLKAFALEMFGIETFLSEYVNFPIAYESVVCAYWGWLDNHADDWGLIGWDYLDRQKDLTTIKICKKDFWTQVFSYRPCRYELIASESVMDEEIAAMNIHQGCGFVPAETSSFAIAMAKLILHHNFASTNEFCSLVTTINYDSIGYTIQNGCNLLQYETASGWASNQEIVINRLPCEINDSTIMSYFENNEILLVEENGAWSILYGYNIYRNSCYGDSYKEYLIDNCRPDIPSSRGITSPSTLKCNLCQYDFLSTPSFW